MFREIGVFEFHPAQRLRYMDGSLREQWAKTYPDIFDARDIESAKTQGRAGYHFNEWLAAVILYQSFGYLSLIEKYELPSHERKHELFRRLLPKKLYESVLDYTGIYRGTQAPDLLVYAPDFSSWFFCEVKGKGDSLKPLQKAYFEHLVDISGQDIGLVRIKEAKSF